MTLTGAENTSFELHVVGYQFPAIEHDEYDSNWLNVKIDVRLPIGAWSSTDPCLLTWELSRLADAIALGNAVDATLDVISEG